MDQVSNFQFIWKEWITPLVEDIKGQIEPDFCQKCHLKTRDLDELAKKAEEYYKEKRKELKVIFYGKNYENDSDTPHRMDFHKLAAIICRTLIEYKVFDFDVVACEEVAEAIDDTNTDWLVKNALVNYRLAFYASVVFLYQSMLFKYSENNPQLWEAIKAKKKLDLYNTADEPAIMNTKRVHESFENCMVLDLSKRDVGNKSFDYFMYATIMYQLEEYNKALVRLSQ